MGVLFSCCLSCIDNSLHNFGFSNVNHQYNVITEPSHQSSTLIMNSPSIENKRVPNTYQFHSYDDPNSSLNLEISPNNTSNKNINSNAYRPYQQPNAGFYIKYELKNELGIGSTSKCFRCVKRNDPKNTEYACKIIDKGLIESNYSGMMEQYAAEIKVLEMLSHPNIVKLEDYFETHERIYIVLELMTGGELFDYVVDKGTLSEEEASILIRKITSAVAHMHSLNIIHRDLKPENLLLTSRRKDAEVKLIDFGLAKIMDENIAQSFLGTRGYLAPEMLQRHAYDKAIDMWALGVINFVLLCGCLPFDDDSSLVSSNEAAKKRFVLRFPNWASNLSESAKDLLHRLLDVDPKTRMTAEQALNHPWISGKTVQINNYLKSPSLIKETVRSPRINPTQNTDYREKQHFSRNSASIKPNLESIKVSFNIFTLFLCLYDI